jgi:hypothetical protein
LNPSLHTLPHDTLLLPSSYINHLSAVDPDIAAPLDVRGIRPPGYYPSVLVTNTPAGPRIPDKTHVGVSPVNVSAHVVMREVPAIHE